jgi:hypothetical protein
MDSLISYASEQNPPVSLVTRAVLEDAEKYKKEFIENYKENLKNQNTDGPLDYQYGYYVIKDDNEGYDGYIYWLKTRDLQEPESMTSKVCDAITPGCLKTRKNNRVYADAGGSKKCAKKTRKQRRHRNSKRNNKK